MTYPAEALCAVDTCGHMFAHHDEFNLEQVCHDCALDVRAHRFRPIILAGGALTPDQERAAYERAMSGDPEC